MNQMKNRVQLIGHLGKDPEIKTTNNGKTLAKFSLATNETYHNGNGEKVTETQWHRLIAWGKTADIVSKYLKKGKEVAIDGKLTTNSFEKDGQKHYMTEVVVNELLLIGPKS